MGDGRGEIGNKGREDGGSFIPFFFVFFAVLAAFAGFIHGCGTPVSASSAPHLPPREVGRGGGPRGRARGVVRSLYAGSVPGLGGDQRLTNDVYAVVLVDICWQNRSPVRHLEWN